MIKSNRIKVKRFAANTADLLGSAAGRKACTLVGVIEGAPPTVVDNGRCTVKFAARRAMYPQ